MSKKSDYYFNTGMEKIRKGIPRLGIEEMAMDYNHVSYRVVDTEQLKRLFSDSYDAPTYSEYLLDFNNNLKCDASVILPWEDKANISIYQTVIDDAILKRKSYMKKFTSDYWDIEDKDKQTYLLHAISLAVLFDVPLNIMCSIK